MPYFQHDNLNIHYFDNEKNTMPFIGLHGLGGDLEQPKDRFQNTGDFRFITLDFRGHGKTVCLNDATLFNMENYANDVLALRQKLGIEQFVIGGISLGAAISLKVAMQMPEQIKALILVRPAWANKPRPAHLQVFEIVSQLLAENDSKTALQKWYHISAYQKLQTTSPGCAASLDGQFSRPQASATWKLLPALVNDAPFQQPEELSNLSMPTLVIGANDPLHPLTLAQKLANWLPNATFQQLTPRYEKPAQYKRELQETVSTFSANYTP